MLFFLFKWFGWTFGRTFGRTLKREIHYLTTPVISKKGFKMRLFHFKTPLIAF